MKILHIITGLGNGGAEAVLFRLIQADNKNTHCVISLADAGTYGSRLSALGVVVHALDMPRGRATLGGLWKLWRTVRQAKPDMVQTWMYHADLVGGLAAWAARRRVVWGIRHSNLSAQETSRSTRLVAKLCAVVSGRVPRLIVSCSQKAAEVHTALGYSANKMRVVPNGYDLESFAPDPEAGAALRGDWGVTEGERLFGMVARWNPQKDHANLIRALALLKSASTVPARCVLIGPGMSEGNTELAQLLTASGVADTVMLLGPRSDIPAVMNALDVHVLSSVGEAFPNVVAEAMACGTPPIATDVGDAALIVGDCGWVAPPSDSERLAEALAAAIAERSDQSAWQKRQQACRERVVENFSLKQMVTAYRTVWREAVSTGERTS